MKEQTIIERGNVFRIESADCLDASMTCTVGRGVVGIEIDDPWAGDSEQGFGQALRFSLSLDTTARLVAYLNQWVNAERRAQRRGECQAKGE